MSDTKWRELNGLGEMLEFTSGKTMARDMSYHEIADAKIRGDCAGVVFDDGSCLVVTVGYFGFCGSDVTPPDPPTVEYYAASRVPLSEGKEPK